MASSATSGSKISITAIATTDVTDTSAEYAALVWTLIGDCINAGEVGDEAQIISYNSIGDARTKKRTGTRDAGDMTLVVAFDGFDAGQLLLRASALTSFRYGIQIELNDKQDANDLNTKFYFQAVVASARVGLGEANSIVEQTFILAITTPIVSVMGTVVP